MQGDDDRYDLDESNMFQTSFNDSSYFGQAANELPQKSLLKD